MMTSLSYPGIARFWIYITVDRCRCLNTFTKKQSLFRCSNVYRLNDIMAALRTVRNHGKAKTFIDICRKDRTFSVRKRSDRRCKKKSLIERLVDTKRCTDFFSSPGKSDDTQHYLHILSFLQYNHRSGASPPPGFLIREPTIRSAPTSVGSIVSTNSP